MNLNIKILIGMLLISFQAMYAHQWTFINKTESPVSVRVHGGILSGHFDTTKTVNPTESQTIYGKGISCRAAIEINNIQVAGESCASGTYNVYPLNQLVGTETKGQGPDGSSQVTVVNNTSIKLNITAQGQIFGSDHVYYPAGSKTQQSSVDVNPGETITVGVELASSKLYYTPYANGKIIPGKKQSVTINNLPSEITITESHSYQLSDAS